jgi:hypothetical protein
MRHRLDESSWRSLQGPSMEVSVRILMFYSSVKQLVAKLEEKLAIRILCLFIR